MARTAALIDPIRQSAVTLTGAASDYDPLMDLIGDARLVLLVEASHGTHEFYRERAEITNDELRDSRIQRAIGVIYRPETERQSHYFYATIPDQFDAMIHFDETRAVEPLEFTSDWDEEPPETCPFTE